MLEVNVVGSNTWYDYELPYWVAYSDNPSPTVSEKRIRVIKETATGDEIDRYCFIKGQAYSNEVALQSNNIDVGAGDVINWSFDYCSENNEPGPVNSLFSILIDDGINPTKKITNSGNWATSGGFSFSVRTGDNVQNWHTVTIKSQPVPYNANMRLFMSSVSSNNNLYESRYRNFNLTITQPDDWFKYAIAQVHKDSNNIVIKNNDDKDITIDDSPRASIAGTLFAYSSSGLLRDRTSTWEYPGSALDPGRLGYLTTLEQMMINYTARSLYYGTILKIWQGAEDEVTFISNFFVFNVLNSGDTRRFVPGSLAIDYKHNKADITLHQITNYEETPDDVDDYYTFNYIYDNG